MQERRINLDKPEVKKLNRVERSLICNIARIDSILEGLKSDFNYIKNMPDNFVQKSSCDDNYFKPKVNKHFKKFIDKEVERKMETTGIKVLSLEEMTIEFEKLKLVVEINDNRLEESIKRNLHYSDELIKRLVELEKRVEELEFIVEIKHNRSWTK